MSTLQGFNENRWRPLTAFQLKVLDNVSRSRSGAGIAASTRRGRTSKGTTVSRLYDYFKYIFNNCGKIFTPLLQYSRLVCEVETDGALSEVQTELFYRTITCVNF